MAKRANKSKQGKSRVRKTSPTKKRRKASARKKALPTHEEDHIDGCDVDFEGEATPDAALPAARGGVEEARTRRRA
jgi:hypothetical protein